jgi:hypothetical protein
MDEVVVVAYGRAKSFLYWFCTIKGRVSKTEQLQTFFLELRDLFQEYKFKVLQVNQVHNLQFELEF